MLQQQLSIAHTTIEVLAVALTSSPNYDSTSATTTSASSPHAERCIALLRAAQWPLPAALEQKVKVEDVVQSPEPSKPASTSDIDVKLVKSENTGSTSSPIPSTTIGPS